jgi:hypothetical protein
MITSRVRPASEMWTLTNTCNGLSRRDDKLLRRCTSGAGSVKMIPGRDDVKADQRLKQPDGGIVVPRQQPAPGAVRKPRKRE